jgi:ubiquinone/menaquinone biosynthesis C-methylase UbiE
MQHRSNSSRRRPAADRAPGPRSLSVPSRISRSEVIHNLHRVESKDMPSQDVTHFTTVDHTADPDFFLRFIDEANKQPAAIAWKPSILQGLRLQPGMRVLDLGCGTGADAFEIADLVSPGGSVTGVDSSESLIGEAVRRVASRGLPVTFQVGDARALQFPNDYFDAVRTERMLMHLPDPSRALAEMARVLRPGGRMVVLDFDWENQFCDSPYKDTTRKIALSFCDGMKNGWIGRCLPRLFHEVGLTDVSVSLHAITVTYDFLQLLLGGHVARAVANGILSEAEADLWWTDLARANAEGRFLYGMTAFIVAGAKV